MVDRNRFIFIFGSLVNVDNIGRIVPNADKSSIYISIYSKGSTGNVLAGGFYNDKESFLNDIRKLQELLPIHPQSRGELEKWAEQKLEELKKQGNIAD